MKKTSKVILLLLMTKILFACAKPEVVSVIMPGDENLNCLELTDNYEETRRFKKEAEKVKEINTGGNMTRTMLFWPALVRTLHNADVAIKAADNRAYHIVKIMKKKKCGNTAKIYSELTKTATPVAISLEIKRLHKLYQKGAITLEEYEQAKKKVINQL